MEFLQRAKIFRLKCSHQNKYLIADQDEETIKLSRDNSSINTHWSFEHVKEKTNVIRLRSCLTGKYLAVSEEHFLLGMTGKRVAQRPWLGPTVEWEPIGEGPYVKLKTHTKTFLRANRGPPPWRNTITHDFADHWTASESMILWIIDIVEIDHHNKSTIDNSKSVDEFKGNNDVPSSLSSNVVDQKVLSSSSSLSTEDDGSLKNPASSLEDCISFSNLKSILGDIDDVEVEYIDGEETISDTERNLPSEVKMVKQPLKELKDMDFRTILSLGRYKELETEIDTIATDAKITSQERNTINFANVREQLKVMKDAHDSATQDLVEYATFANLKLEIKTEVDKDVAKANVLEATLETWFGTECVNSKAKREELLKQLEDTDNSIKAVEMLLCTLEKKRERLEEMEAGKESWKTKKVEAQQKLDHVEKQWVTIKNLFEDAL